MKPFTQEMQGAYELARRIKLGLKNRPKAEKSALYRMQSLILDFIVQLIDINLEQMEVENQIQMSEQEAK